MGGSRLPPQRVGSIEANAHVAHLRSALAYVSQPPCAHLVRLGHSGMPHVARVSRVDVSARAAHVAHVTPRNSVVGRLTWLTLQNNGGVRPEAAVR